MKLLVMPALIVALAASSVARSQGMFIPTSDSRLRADISLLVDEGVVNLPVNEWPLAREDVHQALGAVNDEDVYNPALRAVLMRTRAATAAAEDSADWKLREVRLTTGQPSLLRDEGTLGRENAELMTSGGASTERYGITLAATGVIDTADNKRLRFDGSDISVRWGNWLFSVNQMDRWWGPGHDGSLILSTNARPMPAVSLDRYRSLPINTPWLRWLGPWRFSAFLGVLEKQRPDVNQPLFMGMRLSFKPAPIFEFGMSRTAQFCGKGRDCNFATFGRMLIGKDNPGYRGLQDPTKEPGNQMAGFDARIVSPFRAVPLAVYAQEIGEDNSNSGIPERYLGLFGGETWLMLQSGSVLRAHVEYANTKVKWYDSSAEFDSAYRQGTFFAGYRYHGRNIGHTTDGDSETTSVGLSLTSQLGSYWAAQYRHGRLDRCCGVDQFNTVTAGPSGYKSMDLVWRGDVAKQHIGVQFGYEKRSSVGNGSDKGVFGFVQWRKAL